MPKLSVLTSKELIRILEKKGFLKDHSTGSHFVFRHPDTGKRAVVPYHAKDLPKGTILSIVKQAGIAKEDLL